ncbi:fibropellin-1-like [Lethenteron reissneri]|uniref:fibropellin-1-like n=1 Tax=Lethenteron reissneri TaxID=7753 RepID=UPI002AB6771B|nr:fibropellin-1-like [Lethenteron reissneri]
MAPAFYVDECSDGNNKCAQVCNELNLFENSQGYNCSCFGGFKMQQDGISCQPIVSCTLACTNGRCFIDPNTKRPTCSCNIGYVLDKSKQNCLDLNECEEQPKPCEQECSNTIGSYKCSCSPGFTQDLVVANRCIDVDECQSNPCTNSGTCQNMVNKFSCHCTSGWTGVYCDEDVNECASRPCSHGGTCVNTPGSFSCRCAPGWSGTLCTLLVDECASNPCIHGTCVDQVNAFFCRCDEGWSGNTCTTNIDDCVNAQCQNGATCIDILKGYNCSCVLGYKGQYCQYRVFVHSEVLSSSKSPQSGKMYDIIVYVGWAGSGHVRLLEALFTGRLVTTPPCSTPFHASASERAGASVAAGKE